MMRIQTKTPLLFIFIALLSITSCDLGGNKNRKKFVWDEKIAELTGKQLDSWLRQAPFNNELKKREGNKTIITNAKQVFPFMGRYYNGIEELRDGDSESDTVIFQQRNVLYKDPAWGDLFLHATLLYDEEEVFLDNRYTETGNPFFGGVETVTDTHSASLYETSVFAKQPQYKTGLYWATIDFNRYLVGFYQQGQLVFETAIPLLGSDTAATLDKLKEVNEKLGLNIPEWENAFPKQLQSVDSAKSFWEDTFIGIYPGDYMLNEVYLKIKNTPFILENTAPKGDYYFTYQSHNGLVELYTILQQTHMDEAAFHKENRELNSYRYNYQDIFYADEISGGYCNGTAKIFAKDNQYLEVHYRYPETDSEAKEHVHEILRYIKVRKL